MSQNYTKSYPTFDRMLTNEVYMRDVTSAVILNHEKLLNIKQQKPKFSGGIWDLEDMDATETELEDFATDVTPLTFEHLEVKDTEQNVPLTVQEYEGDYDEFFYTDEEMLKSDMEIQTGARKRNLSSESSVNRVAECVDDLKAEISSYSLAGQEKETILNVQVPQLEGNQKDRNKRFKLQEAIFLGKVDSSFCGNDKEVFKEHVKDVSEAKLFQKSVESSDTASTEEYLNGHQNSNQIGDDSHMNVKRTSMENTFYESCIALPFVKSMEETGESLELQKAKTNETLKIDQKNELSNKNEIIAEVSEGKGTASRMTLQTGVGVVSYQQEIDDLKNITSLFESLKTRPERLKLTFKTEMESLKRIYSVLEGFEASKNFQVGSEYVKMELSKPTFDTQEIKGTIEEKNTLSESYNSVFEPKVGDSKVEGGMSGNEISNANMSGAEFNTQVQIPYTEQKIILDKTASAVDPLESASKYSHSETSSDLKVKVKVSQVLSGDAPIPASGNNTVVSEKEVLMVAGNYNKERDNQKIRKDETIPGASSSVLLRNPSRAEVKNPSTVNMNQSSKIGPTNSRKFNMNFPANKGAKLRSSYSKPRRRSESANWRSPLHVPDWRPNKEFQEKKNISTTSNYIETRHFSDDVIHVTVFNANGEQVDEIIIPYDNFIQTRNFFLGSSGLLPDRSGQLKKLVMNVETAVVLLRFLFYVSYVIPSWEVALEVYAVAKKYRLKNLQDSCTTVFNNKTLTPKEGQKIFKIANFLDIVYVLEKSLVFSKLKITPDDMEGFSLPSETCSVSWSVYSEPLDISLQLISQNTLGRKSDLGSTKQCDITNEINIETNFKTCLITGFQLKLDVDISDKAKSVIISYDLFKNDSMVFGKEQEKKLQNTIIIIFNHKFVLKPNEKGKISILIEDICFRLCCLVSEDKVKNENLHLSLVSDKKSKLEVKPFFVVEKVFYTVQRQGF